ncbi:MAG TPA: hypothetical protein VLM79_39600 [Kofleriaceae bacterium]|nr:hypothetical protein [Kofleriaceae bacterium]
MVRGHMVVAALVALAPWAGAGCHVVVTSDIARPVATERIAHPEGAIARRPTIALTEAGRLRFVEPLECPTEEIVRRATSVEVVTRPNLATFTVGVIAATVGGVLLTSGLFSSRPGTSPITYVGVAGVAAGLPLAIGPWLGDGSEVRPRSDDAEPPLRRPGPSQPCGERPLAAKAATLATVGLEVHGAVDRDGVFAISPYQWIDAFGAASARPTEVTAIVDGEGGARTVTAILEAGAITKAAAGFLAAADFDTRIEPMRLVPGIAPEALRVGLVVTERGPALRVVMPLRNDGPGDAWQLRGQIAAPPVPAIDGRMIYIGHLAKGSAASSEVVIPLSRTAAIALRGATIELSVELRDAHGTAPTTPVRFRGQIGDASR